MKAQHTSLLKNIVDAAPNEYVLQQKEKRYIKYLLENHYPIKVIQANGTITALWIQQKSINTQ